MLQPSSIGTPIRTKEILAKHNIFSKKSLGQNFLVDMNILQRIIQAAQFDHMTGVLEIGPGIGALTEQLAQCTQHVVAVELDQRLLPILKEVMRPYDHVHIIHHDILKINLPNLFHQYFQQVEKVNVVANLPYYITTPIIMKLLKARIPLHNIVVMMQKEVAQRMMARPGGKEYGSLSIYVQYFSDIEMICSVSHKVFIPQPNVDSTVIRLRVRKSPPVHVNNEELFFDVVQASFAQRRKTIWNNLKIYYATQCDIRGLVDALASAGIETSRRGETLSLQEFAQLSNAMGDILQ